MKAIEVDHLRRTYILEKGPWFRRSRRTVEAVRDLSFEVAEGELFGMLGPNGAGKTTTIRILTTLLYPTAGRAAVLGLDVVGHARDLRRRIGIVFGGERGLYGRLSARDNLRYFANLYGLVTREARPRIDHVLEAVGLSQRSDDRVDTYSRGMKQRLHLARALLHDPAVLFLDEPTLGLDPIGAREIRQLVKELRSSGRTVLLTTHYMFEADELCDRVAIIDRGALLALEPPDRLRGQAPDLYLVEIELEGAVDGAVEALQRVAGSEAVIACSERNAQPLLQIRSRRGRDLVKAIPPSLGGARVRAIQVREPTLEDVYVRLIEAAHGGRLPLEAGA